MMCSILSDQRNEVPTGHCPWAYEFRRFYKSEIPDSKSHSRFDELSNESLHLAEQRIAPAERFREELKGNHESAAFG